MRTVFFLMLLVTLVFNDGWAQFNSEPCQRSWNNNAYNNFKRKHILPYRFETNSNWAWADYLKRNGLCGRTPEQSFLRRDDTSRIKSICSRNGIRDAGNKCISRETFRVYIVESALRNGKCEVKVHYKNSYVIVACDVIGNRCLPVHYETQTNTRPQYGQACIP